MNAFSDPTVTRRSLTMPWHKRHSGQGAAGMQGGRRLWQHTLGAILLIGSLGFAAPEARALDVNQASAQQLETIRGIGPRTAEIIINERERGGRFESFEDLAERVRGIGEKKAKALEAAGLQVGEGDAAANAAAATAAAASAAAAPAAAAVAPSSSAASKPAGKPANRPATGKTASPPPSRP
ncbi:ComE operon protein 1 [compost metagenome]